MATAALVTAQAGRLSIAPRPRRTDPDETSHALLICQGLGHETPGRQAGGHSVMGQGLASGGGATGYSRSSRIYGTRAEARRDLFQYIEGFYNSRRLHSDLGYISPAFGERTAA